MEGSEKLRLDAAATCCLHCCCVRLVTVLRTQVEAVAVVVAACESDWSSASADCGRLDGVVVRHR